MNLAAIQMLESEIQFNRREAAKLSLMGWPGDANYHRRQAVKAARLLRRGKGNQLTNSVALTRPRPGA